MTASNTSLATALTLLAGLVLTGCGAPEPTSSIKPDGGPYTNVGELRAAYIEAGGDCEDWRDRGPNGYGGGTIECDGSSMIDVVSDSDKLEKYRDDFTEKSNVQSIESTWTWLQGENWMVRSTEEEVAAMKEILGGEIVSFKTGPTHR
ncbi:hypothetical protein ACX80N_12355 [Arthrobacter sp. MDT2-16]